KRLPSAETSYWALAMLGDMLFMVNRSRISPTSKFEPCSSTCAPEIGGWKHLQRTALRHPASSGAGSHHSERPAISHLSRERERCKLRCDRSHWKCRRPSDRWEKTAHRAGLPVPWHRGSACGRQKVGAATGRIHPPQERYRCGTSN